MMGAAAPTFFSYSHDMVPFYARTCAIKFIKYWYTTIVWVNA